MRRMCVCSRMSQSNFQAAVSNIPLIVCFVSVSNCDVDATTEVLLIIIMARTSKAKTKRFTTQVLAMHSRTRSTDSD